MPRILFCLFFFFPLLLTAQEKLTYYDIYWKLCDPTEARFFSIKKKTDSGWLRYDYFMRENKVQMTALYEDEDCKVMNGYTNWYYYNGIPSAAGRFIHGKREGVCVSWHPNGMISDSGYFHNDKPQGLHLGWHANGYQRDSMQVLNDSSSVYVSWFSNGLPYSAGYRLYDKPHGSWQYFHNTGQPAAKIKYEHGRVLSAEYFDESGKAITDTSHTDRDAAMAKGRFLDYLNKKLYWPKGLEFSNGNVAAVEARFTVNEDGKVEDVWIATPLHPQFDEIVVSIIKSCPAWKPRLDHNRRVKEYFKQVVTYEQEE